LSAEEKLTPSGRYQKINHTIRQHSLQRMTRYLCRLAHVSTSGYYRWLNAETDRQLQDEADEHDFKLISASWLVKQVSLSQCPPRKIVGIMHLWKRWSLKKMTPDEFRSHLLAA
jgi:hypothetical protein